MSLVNQMLRDLDARHAPDVDRRILPAAMQAPRRRRKSLMGLVLLLALTVAAAWLALERFADVTPPPSPVPMPVVASPPPPRAAIPTAPASPSPATVAEEDAGARTEAMAPSAPAIPAAKVAAAVAAPRPKEAPASPKTAATRPSAAAESAGPAPTASGAVRDAMKTAEAAADPSSIDMHPRSVAPENAAEGEYRKAMAALRRGAASDAVEGLRAALRLDAKHVSARQALLGLMVEQQRWPEAQALLDEGLALDPSQTAWAMLLARMQVENGRPADAAETLARHASFAGQNAEYIAFQALLMQRLKRLQEAADRYRAALAIKPAEARWWYGLGLALEADRNVQEARNAYLKAREIGNLPPELAAAVEQKLK